MEHFVKSWPPFFWDSVKDKKTFDLRNDDRGFEVGDILVQEEFDPDMRQKTGRKNRREIVYIMRGEEIPKTWGLKEGYCILGLVPIEKKGGAEDFGSPEFFKKIIKSAIRSAKPERGSGSVKPLWACVKDVFLLGAGYSQRLCRMFGFDPDDMIEPEFCEGCHFDRESDQELCECPKSLNAGFHSTNWQNGEGPCCWCGEEVKK